MAGYIGSKAVSLSTTAADVTGDAEIGGDLTVDTDTLHVDSANNRVGIGNTSPTQALDVTGDIVTSGGVYLGGTGSANKLDDYEEGTWTPSFAFDIGGTGITYGNRSGYYTKIGQLVHITFTIEVTGGVTSSDYYLRLALPFTATSVGNAFGRVSVQNTFRSGFNVATNAGTSDMLCFATNGLTDYARGDDVPAGTYVGGEITYRTTA